MKISRELADVVRVDLADLSGALRRVVRQVPSQPGEDRLHLYADPVLQHHLEAALERRIGAHLRQGVPRRLRESSRQRVPPIELILPVPLVHVAAAQEAAVVLAHEQGEIGLLLDEFPLVEVGVDDHLAHGQGQSGVGADAHGQVVVGVDRRGAVVGGDRHDLAAVVPRLGDVVIPLDVGVDRVGVPDQRQVRQEPVVHAGGRIEEPPGQVPAGAEVLELRVAVGRRQAQMGTQQPRGRGPDLRCQQREDRLRTLLLDGVEHGVGDVGERRVPGDGLELALAALSHALERLGDAVGGVEAMAPAGALLATHRVVVGDARLDRRGEPRLLLAHYLPVLREDAKRAASRVAVHGVAAPAHAVPGPPLAVPIRPVALHPPNAATRRRHRCPLPAVRAFRGARRSRVFTLID
jgi:hypothetical protein